MDWLKSNASTVVLNLLLVLIIAIVAPTLFLAVGNKSDIASLSKGQENLVKRVDRIADELGAVGIRIAAETIRAPFKTVLLTTKPFQKVDGGWARNAHLLDTKLGTVAIYTLQLEAAQDVRASYGLSGSIHNVDDRAVSLEKMQAIALEAGVFGVMPAFIDGTVSFVSYEQAAVLAKTISLLGHEPDRKIQATLANTWEALLTEISLSPKWLVPAGNIK